MYINYFYPLNGSYPSASPSNPNYYQQPYYDYNRFYRSYPNYNNRQQSIQGQATWTEGGQVTQCGLPWSHGQYMTAAVGVNTPYQCGQTLKVKYPTTQREMVVTVVDRVQGFPENRLNLHRRVFEALGANPMVGVIDIEITPSLELEQEKWGKYLVEVTQTAYPTYNVTDYSFVEKTEVSPTQTKETYNFILQNQQEKIKLQGTVIYNPSTDRVISFDLKEV